MRIRDFINKNDLKTFSGRSDAMAAWVTVFNFAVLAASFALPILVHHWLAWVAAAILLAGRAQSLAILVHDTAHLAMFSSRAVNEWTGRWLFGGLPNVVYRDYRDGHLAHHRHAGTDKDADLAFVDTYPASTASLLRKLLRDVSGVNGIKHILYQLRTFTLRAQAPFMCSHLLLLGALAALGQAEVYLCWWAGQIFVFPLLIRLRVMGEHGGVPDHYADDARLNTGTVMAGPIARLLLAPNYVNFHLEHHYAPGVPAYRLKRFHRLLKARGAYDGWDCVRASYFDVLKRCWSGSSAAPRPDVKRAAKGTLYNTRS